MVVRKKKFVFFILLSLLSFVGVVNATDFNITAFQNITDNCNPNYLTYTYNCSVDSNGDVWDNIYSSINIDLPNDHGGRYNADSWSIIFQVKNEFKSLGAITTAGVKNKCGRQGSGGHAGNIKITAKIINITSSIYSNGAYCRDYDTCEACNTGGEGGTMNLVADVINVANIYSYGGDGASSGGSAGGGGNVYITANNLTVSMIDVHSGSSSQSSGRSAGTIDLDVKNIDIGTINAYSKQVDFTSGVGGIINMVAENISLGNINAYAGRSYYSSGQIGGQIDILSTYATLGNININGGQGRDSGGLGGNLILNVDNIYDIGTISANTGYGADRYGKIGGSVKIYSIGDLVLSTISANGGPGGADDSRRGIYTGGPGGTVIVDTNGILTVSSTIDTYGGAGGHKDDNDGHAGGNGGKIYLNAEEIRVNGLVRANGGRGGNADDWTDDGATGGSGGDIRLVSNILKTTQEIQAIGGNGGNGGACSAGGSGGPGGNIDIYNSDSFLVSRLDSVIRVNGGVGDASSDCSGTDCVCGSGGAGGTIDLFNDNPISISSGKFNVLGGSAPAVSASYCDGTCGYNGNTGTKDLNSRTVPTGFRLTSNIEELSTNNHFTGSTQIRIIDPAIGTHVYTTNTYNAWFGETDIDDGQVNSLFGDKPLMVMLAKKYYLEITTSDDLFFSKINCDFGIADCDTHFVEFRQYYE